MPKTCELCRRPVVRDQIETPHILTCPKYPGLSVEEGEQRRAEWTEGYKEGQIHSSYRDDRTLGTTRYLGFCAARYAARNCSAEVR